jgi:hypothetical protein
VCNEVIVWKRRVPIGVPILLVEQFLARRQMGDRGCYILFTMNANRKHAHITVTHDPLFPTWEERYDQLGPFTIDPSLDPIEQRIAQPMNDWLAQPANVDWLRKSNTPVAVFHDERANDAVLTSSVPQHVVDCIHQSKAIYAKVYTLDPLDAARLCKW